MSDSIEQLPDRLDALRQRIFTASRQACRAEPVLLAVSKRQPVSAIQVAYRAGLRAFGESYLKEAIPKIQALQDLSDLEWHFIGPLQSNKTANIAEHFHWVHSVDRLKIAQRLNEQRPEQLPPLNICIQVNVDAEPQKSGVTADQLGALLTAIRPLTRLRVRGLMCIPAERETQEQQREPFRQLAELFDHWAPIMGSDWDTLSMGMSDDLHAAILEGSTLIRVGTALFGERTISTNDSSNPSNLNA